MEARDLVKRERDEGGVYWADRDIGVRWPVDRPLVSKRDNSYPRLRELSPEKLPRSSQL